jgi:hypothetical protein
MMGIQNPETLMVFNELTQLIAREDFISVETQLKVQQVIAL